MARSNNGFASADSRTLGYYHTRNNCFHRGRVFSIQKEDKETLLKKFWAWLKTGTINVTRKIPFPKKGEKFAGLKFAWPWGKRKDE